MVSTGRPEDTAEMRARTVSCPPQTGGISSLSPGLNADAGRP